MLATLGVITILCLLAAVMSKRLSPLVALIALPIIAALIGGFGLQTSAFIITGIKNVAPVVGMFVFAILFFGVMTDAGMLDPIIDAFSRPSAHARRESSWVRRCWRCWCIWTVPAR